MPSLLDEAMKVGQELEGAERRRNALESQIAAKQQELKVVSAEVERVSREIVHQAQQTAKGLTSKAEAILQAVNQKLVEVVAREMAVEWVKAEDARLKVVVQDIARQQKEIESSRSNVTAKEDLYVGKLKEVIARENAVAQRESPAKKVEAPAVSAPKKAK